MANIVKVMECLNSLKQRIDEALRIEEFPIPSNPCSFTSSVSSDAGLVSDVEDNAAIEGAAPSVCSTKRKMSDHALDESEVISETHSATSKKTRCPRYNIRTRTDMDVIDDGFKWRKYGQKSVKNSPHKRYYYRCSTPLCSVRKRVERAQEDPGLLITTYKGTHTHSSVGAASSNASSRSSESSNAAFQYRSHSLLDLSQTGAKEQSWVTTSCNVEDESRKDLSLGSEYAPPVPSNYVRPKMIKSHLSLLGLQLYLKSIVTDSNIQSFLGLPVSLPYSLSQNQGETKIEAGYDLVSGGILNHEEFDSARFLHNLRNAYINCGEFEDLCFAEGVHGEEMVEIGRGRLTAALFPGAFCRHLEAFLTHPVLSTLNFLHLLQEASNLVVKDLPYATNGSEVGDSQSFQFFDEVYDGDPIDIGDVFSLGGLIAICQTFPQGENQNLEDLGTEYSTEYCIVQHDLTGAYLCRRVVRQILEDQLIENAIGVLGVEVTGKDIHIENIRDDGSYYCGTLKDFAYQFVLNKNGDSEAMDKQCATRLFGHLKGAEFLAGKEYGLKCSPLVAVALTIATQKKRTLALKWNRTNGHMEIDDLEHCTEFGKIKWQVLYTDKINQLGLDVEWGMEQVLQPYEMTCSQTSGTSNYSRQQALSSMFGNGVQDRRSVGLQIGLPGGVTFGGTVDLRGSKGKELAHVSHSKLMEHERREASQFVEISNLDARHSDVKTYLHQGRLHDARENYLVVWDDADNGHVSVYWAMEDGKLEWTTDILLACGKRERETLFKGKLKGLRMKVKRDGSKLVSTNAHKPASDLISRFKKHKQLDIDSSMIEVPTGLQSNDEWVHLIGPQARYSGNKYFWEASYMRAVISSRTSYLSGAMLDTFVLRNEIGEIGHCSTNKFDETGQSDRAARLVHQCDKVVAWGQFSKAPMSLVQGTNLIKWGGLIDDKNLC